MQSNPTGETYFLKKREYALYLISVLIFLIHMSPIAQYADTGDLISVINQKTAFFLKESFTRFAIPMFFMVSGVTFFKDYDNKNYFQKLKICFLTLVVPYLIWNAVWTVFEIVCSYTFISNFYVGRVPMELTVENVLQGLFHHKYNGTFWFIFDVIVFTAAAPLLHLVIRNKYVGIAAILALMIASRFGIHLPTAVFYSVNSIIYYLLGGIIGIHFFELLCKKSGKAVQWASVIYFSLYVGAKNLFAANAYMEKPIVDVIVFVLCAWAVWNMLDLFIDKITLKPIHSRSLVILTMHINVSAVITKLIYLALPKTPWLAIPNFIATFLLSIVAMNLFCVALERFAPKLSPLFTGTPNKV